MGIGSVLTAQTPLYKFKVDQWNIFNPVCKVSRGGRVLKVHSLPRTCAGSCASDEYTDIVPVLWGQHLSVICGTLVETFIRTFAGDLVLTLFLCPRPKTCSI